MMKKESKKPPAARRDIENPRRIIRQGMLIILLFFGVLGVWAAVCHITGAVVAQGAIKIESERKTVQHLEGGIVEAIHVREGEAVKEGQPLVTLESVQIDASEQALAKQLIAQLAARARFAAEKEGLANLVWPRELSALIHDAEDRDTLNNEEKLFHARMESLSGQVSLLNAQLAQVKEQIIGSQEIIKAENSIIAALDEELRAKRQLYEEQYLEKSQILELERTLASHQGERGRQTAAIAEAKQKDAELRLRIVDTEQRFMAEAVDKLATLDNEILQTREKIRPMRDAQKRLTITAPVSGRVVDIKVHSRGGVIRSGEPLLDIVPLDNPLIVEARLPVNKITEVYPGQKALVKLDAFDARITPYIDGRVTYVSADRLEEKTDAGAVPYYLGWVELDKKSLAAANMYISPGMPATVFLTTKERTVLYYTFESLLKGWERALRD
ncbi:MAG: HlyD family type I secretion periplasmic adaptor subunit [Desulfobulbaceae bacterium]|jgi:HlyD family secretion protein/epimerase transport system membrane fusion protein|nr:HlyD family type I secretion periplasmic adaptor subunit [Desulfobulbaceae bacterium]